MHVFTIASLISRTAAWFACLQVWHTLPGSPYFTTLYHASATFLVILAGACIAFLMVWAEYKVIKETSALTFMIAGIVKEVREWLPSVRNVPSFRPLRLGLLLWATFMVFVLSAMPLVRVMPHGPVPHSANGTCHGFVIAICWLWLSAPETCAHRFLPFTQVVVVIAAVVLMGDHFGPENVVGLCIVILGVVLFNVYKYRKIRAGELSPKSVSPKSEKKKADEGIALQALSNGAAGAKGDAELAPLLPVQRKGSNPL